MKQFKRQITATVGAILIALALIGINAAQAVAQGKARKGAKVRSGGGSEIAPNTEIPFMPPLIDIDARNPKIKPRSASTIISPRDSASGLPTAKRVNQAGTTSFSPSKNEVSIETIERSVKRNPPQGLKIQMSTSGYQRTKNVRAHALKRRKKQ
ncbi:MAG TPA: hypothetical protein VJ810_09150 [Blastocatellia bacterium]|nr:hypothetical protein [Blastocatellia bacterium]